MYMLYFAKRLPISIFVYHLTKTRLRRTGRRRGAIGSRRKTRKKKKRGITKTDDDHVMMKRGEKDEKKEEEKEDEEEKKTKKRYNRFKKIKEKTIVKRRSKSRIFPCRL